MPANLKELAEKIPPVGGALENRLLELNVGLPPGDDTKAHMEAAALLLHEIYDALLSSSSAARTEGWQPIESHHGDAEAACVRYLGDRYNPEVAKWDGRFWRTSDGEALHKPDFWMPLCPLPSASALDQEPTTEGTRKKAVTAEDIYRVDRSAVERQLGRPIKKLSPGHEDGR